MGKPSTNELLRRSIDLADLAAEGLERLDKLLAVLAHLAIAAEQKHIGTLVAEAQIISDDFMNRMDSDREDLAALQAEASHAH